MSPDIAQCPPGMVGQKLSELIELRTTGLKSPASQKGAESDKGLSSGLLTLANYPLPREPTTFTSSLDGRRGQTWRVQVKKEMCGVCMCACVHARAVQVRMGRLAAGYFCLTHW